MNEKNDHISQEEQLGRKPDQKQASEDVFRHVPENPMSEVPDGDLPPERHPHEPGFDTPDPAMMERGAKDLEEPPEDDYDKKNDSRPPEQPFGDDMHQLGEELRREQDNQKKAG